MTEYSGAFYPEAACATSSPKAGCEKITFSGTSYEAGKDYTAVGKLVGNQFEEYSTGKSGILAGHWLKLGPGSFKETMSAVSSADSGWTIGLYLGSVFCFWLGLVLLAGPILQLIEFIPIIGGFGEGLIKVIFGVFSFVIMGLAFLIVKLFLVYPPWTCSDCRILDLQEEKRTGRLTDARRRFIQKRRLLLLPPEPSR